MPNWRTELAKLEQAVAPPICIGTGESHEDPFDFLCRGIRGDEDVLFAVRRNHRQRGLRPDSRDCLLEIIRSLDVAPPPQRTPQTAEKTNQFAPPPAAPPGPPPPAEVPAAAPTPTSQRGATSLEPFLSCLLGEDLDPKRATSMGATVLMMPPRPDTREYRLTPGDKARRDVIWVRCKRKLGFRQGNQYWVADPLLRQPQAAPLWVRQDVTWAYAINGGLLEEV